MLGLLWLLSCFDYVYAADNQAEVPEPNPKLGVLNQVGIDQHLNAQVPLELSFQDEQGNTVQLSELLDGKPVILNLAYFRCPMLCNRTRDGLIKTLRTMELSAGEEFDVITVSFDPQERPTLATEVKSMTLAQYDRTGSAAGWHFLTGSQKNIARLADSVGFRFAWDDRTGRFAHAAGIMILTPDGRVSRYLNGVEFTARDLRLSLIEASSGQIGSATDQVLLLCYQYDPARGKYGLAIMNVLRISGVLTILIIVTGVGLLFRRERFSRQAAESSTTVSRISNEEHSNQHS